jgi:hypothetical protein
MILRQHWKYLLHRTGGGGLGLSRRINVELPNQIRAETG